MIATTVELRHRRGQAVTQMEEILDRRLTPESRQKFDLLDAEQRAIRTKLDSLEQVNRMDYEAQESYHRAWRAAMRFGLNPSEFDRGVSADVRAILNRGEQRDMGVGVSGGAFPGSTSGFFAPLGFEDKVESALKDYGCMLAVGTPIDTTTGSPLPYPTDNDTTTIGEQVDEHEQVAAVDVPLGQFIYRSFKYSSKMVKLSLELLQDSAFDFETYLSDKFAYRIARVLNPLFTNGSGTGQPQGIITGATVGVTAIGASSSDGGVEDGSNSVGADDLIDLEFSLDFAYRQGAMYMVKDSTLKAIKLLKDKSGRLVWQPGLAAGTVDTVNAYPVVVNPDMAPIAPGSITVAFGRLDKYAIRRAGPMWVQRLQQRFIDQGQIGFIGWARRDGRLIDAGSHPVKLLQQRS